jgi:hypothetical protein
MRKLSVLTVVSMAAVLTGQQKVRFQNNIPVAPKGFAGRPLPKLPSTQWWAPRMGFTNSVQAYYEFAI